MHIFLWGHFYCNKIIDWDNHIWKQLICNIQSFADGVLRSTSRHPKNAKHSALFFFNFVILDTLDLLSLKLYSSSSQHFFLFGKDSENGSWFLRENSKKEFGAWAVISKQHIFTRKQGS